MEIKDYLQTLSPETFATVAGYVTRDQFGIVHPEVSTTCNPACSGPGKTTNGYWVCSNGACVWIPAA
jgi:hypothetical protein